MNVLVIGSGGREHALVWKLRQSPRIERLYCAPGNAGIEEVAELVPLQASDLGGLVSFAKERHIDLTIVGPEQPLVDGIVDLFEENGLAVFGPSRAAARLEGSKVFAKDFMLRHGIPTARHASFLLDERERAFRHLQHIAYPSVVKVDGLAAGKGVAICHSQAEARAALEEIFVQKTFGTAGNRVVVEEFLRGEEASVFVLTDGESIVPLASAQDHKRAYDNDEGKNTGGMGAYAPAPLVTPAAMKEIIERIVVPTVEGMKREGSPYRGCLYCGLMMTKEGPKVLEYNCRFGDPEAQVVLPLLAGDFAEIVLAVAQRRLSDVTVNVPGGSAVCVVMASAGYPDRYETGRPILGLDAVRKENDVVVFHAGTKKRNGEFVTAGGRVLGVTALGTDLASTIRRAYQAVENIRFEGAHYRRDIGRKAFKSYERNSR